MQRACDICSRPYEAKRPSSRYCSDTCRKRSQRSTKPSTAEAEASTSCGVADAVERELVAAGRRESSAGQRALFLARTLESAVADSGSAKAALDKQLATALEQALDGAKRAADPLDELRARRERRNA